MSHYPSIDSFVRLTEIRPSDKPAMIKHLQEREIYDRTLRIPYPYTEADADEWLARVAKATQEQGRPVNFAIRDENDYFIGGCGFHDFQIGQSHRAEIGYYLAKPYWGRGIMTAVVRGMCAFAFAELNLSKIAAHVFAPNLASARVLEKCGFEQEGYLRKHFLKDGQLLDVRLFGLLR